MDQIAILDHLQAVAGVLGFQVEYLLRFVVGDAHTSLPVVCFEENRDFPIIGDQRKR